MQDPCCFICGPDGGLPPGRYCPGRPPAPTAGLSLCSVIYGQCCGSLLLWPGRALPTQEHGDIGPGLSTLHSHLTQSLKGSHQHPMACIEDLLKILRNTQIQIPKPPCGTVDAHVTLLNPYMHRNASVLFNSFSSCYIGKLRHRVVKSFA